MAFEFTLLIIYRLMAAIVAGAMIWVVLRNRDWTNQVLAAIVLVPFALRAAGVK